MPFSWGSAELDVSLIRKHSLPIVCETESCAVVGLKSEVVNRQASGSPDWCLSSSPKDGTG